MKYERKSTPPPMGYVSAVPGRTEGVERYCEPEIKLTPRQMLEQLCTATGKSKEEIIEIALSNLLSKVRQLQDKGFR